MPWTIIELGEAQIEPGKPRYPLNVGVPPRPRMNFSASRSSSAVVTPARTFPASIASVATSTSPERAIFSISSGTSG